MPSPRFKYSDFLRSRTRTNSPDGSLEDGVNTRTPCPVQSPKDSFGEDNPEQQEERAVTASRIDFASRGLPEYDGLYAVLIDDVFTRAECAELVKSAEETACDGWERAMINIGGGHQALYSDTRNCGRIIWDSQEVVDAVWDRISHLPEIQEILRLESVPQVVGYGPTKRGEVWNFTRPNERMRFLKYVGGEYFRPHCDGSYETPDRTERSYFTLHLYLNDAGPPPEQQLRALPKEDRKRMIKSSLHGGATSFHSYNMKEKLDVVPKAGQILIFQHRNLLHSGDDVVQGVKYTMRTDLMYTVARSQSGD